MKKRIWLNVLKWVWLIIVFGSVTYYVSTNFNDIFEYLKNVSPIYLLFSISLLVFGKVFLVVLSIQSVSGQDWTPRFTEMFYINAQMQLAKYLPGGVWHFVGRFGLYRKNGLGNSQASRAILIENIWLVLSAFFFGLCAIKISQQDFVFFGGGMIAWFITMLLINRVILHQDRFNIWFLVKLILTQAAIWFFLGAGFWVLLFSINIDLQLVGISLGSFSLSWAAGYVSVFAPSGIGVREVTITLLLKNIMNSEIVLFYATLNRFVWVITEIFLGLVGELFFGSGRSVEFFRRIKKDANH